MREETPGLQNWKYMLPFWQILMILHLLTFFSCFLPCMPSFCPRSTPYLSCQERAEKATDSAAASQRRCPVSGGNPGWGGWRWDGWDLPFRPSFPSSQLFQWSPADARSGHTKALQSQDEGSPRGQLLQRRAWLPGRHHGAACYGYFSNGKKRMCLLFQFIEPNNKSFLFNQACHGNYTCGWNLFAAPSSSPGQGSPSPSSKTLTQSKRRTTVRNWSPQACPLCSIFCAPQRYSQTRSWVWFSLFFSVKQI